MILDDEEKKKREEEARQIISSFSNNTSNINTVNYANSQNIEITGQNEADKKYILKIQEANDIINSINPREDVSLPELTEEERKQSIQNTQDFMDLIDGQNLSQQSISNNSNVSDIQNNNTSDNNRRESWNVIARGNKLSSLKNDEEIQQENAQKEFTLRKDTDKNILSQLGKFVENAWLGGVNGVMQAVKTVTDVEYENKGQENELLAGNNPNISESVTQEYKTQNDNSILNNKIKKDKSNNQFSLIRFTPEYQKMNSTNNNLLSAETKNRIDNDIKNYTNKYNEIELNPLQLQLENSIDENNQKISNNTNEISNPIIKKMSEIAPSTANSLVGAGLSAVNPMLGLSYFTTSAMGNYEDNGRQMGMSKNEAKVYSRVMGLMESVTEMVGIDKFLSAGNQLKQGMFKQALKEYGISMADNAIQEAIIDPIDEGVAYLSSGKTKNDYSTPEGARQLISDMLKDGFNGALSAMMMDAVGMGINSAIRVYDKIQNGQVPTQQEIITAYNDINKDGRIDKTSYFDNSFNFEKDKIVNGNTGEYYILDFDNDGNIVNVNKGQGTIIDYQGKANISPVAMLINDNYNVIDANSGLKLDTTPYQTIEEAATGFNNKMSNSNETIVNEINNRVNKAKLSIINTLNQSNVDVNTGISNTQMYNRDTTIKLLNENGINTNNIQNRSYLGKEINDIIKNPNFYIPTRTNNTDATNKNNNVTSLEQNSSTFYDDATNYAVQDINKVTEPFKKQRTYNKEELADIWNKIDENDFDAIYDDNWNIKSYIAMEEDGSNIVINQYDSNDNVVKSEIIPSNQQGKYTSRAIKETIEKESSLYDENRPIKGQQDIEGNEVKSMKRKIEKKKDTKISKKIEEYIAKNPNLEPNLDISTSIVNDINIKEIKQMEAYKKARDLFSQIHKRKFQNNNTKMNIYVTNSDIKESINTTYTYTEQRKYLKENIAIYSQLDNIIENAELISNTNELKGRQKYQQWDYYAIPINIDNNKFIVQFDTVQREDGETHFRVERLYKITEEGDSTTVVPTEKSATRFTVEPPSTMNSIPQNTKSVKNKTTTNKQSMQNNKNNTSKAITSLNDIKLKYKIQTDQLNIFENKDNTISINNLVVKQSLRNKGIGQNILDDIISYADKNNKTITLTPTSKYLTKKRLTNWYKKNGFVENKGRNINYSISDTMYRLPKNSTNNNIRSMKQNTNKVTDSEGRTLTKQQQEYFKDSKVRDENGNLLVMYHGTEANVGIPEDFWFTIFDIDKAGNHGSMLGDGFYFTSDRSHAEQYAHTRGNIYETYLNIKNPLELNNFSTGDLTYAIRNINPYIEADIYKRDGTIDGYKVRRYLLDNGYDGVHSGNTYVAFYANQIKNITNSSPTISDDIRYMKKNTSKNKTSTNNKSKNLIAQHNTSEEKLLEALNLGALPVPSIAITKSDTPISNYGNITLLFNKDTINPTDRRNVAYNSDIYSSRRPQTVNSLDKNKVKAFEKSMNDKGISYGYISQIEEYIQDNDFARAKDSIRYELQKVNPDVTEQEIEDSFTEAIEIIKDKRILRDDVDPYTPSGNRRTIEQMSVPYTLDNIVRIMTKKSNKGSESNNFAGLPEVRANLSQQFKNIEEMHQQENNIVSTEEMQKIKEELNDEFYNLIDEIGKYDTVERYFGSADTVANALNETAKAKNVSKEVLENELDFVSITNVPDEVLQKAIDFLNSLKNVPTEYFEVKPQRAVDLSEIQSAIVPKNISKEVIDKLKEHNIPITYYESEQERNKLITSETENKNIRFAKKTAKPKNETIEEGQRNAERDTNYIEQEIRKIERTGNWDDSIPVTKMADIRKTIEDYLGIGVQKGHFRQQAYGIYKSNRDVLRTKELKDIDTILHETGHALDIGDRIKINKESISNELLKAVENYGGYEAETREVQLEEGVAEVIREYTIIPEQAKIDYPQTVAILEGIMQENKNFDNFIKTVQKQTYNYIHQNPRNRTLSNISIGERTDKTKWSREWIKQEVYRNIYDKDFATKEAVNTLAKMQGKTMQDIKASENAYYLVRLTNGIGDKVSSMLANGYIDEQGNKLMPGLNQIGEILGNNPERFNDLRAYLVARRDLEYKSKTLKTGLRTMDSNTVIEQFKNDKQIQEAAKVIYDTLDGVLQYAINNGLITDESAKSIRESNIFYVPMQRVLEGNKNNIGRRGAVSDIIKKRTGSELDVKDVLENIIANSSNIIQQVENNNILKALYKEGEESGLTGTIYDVIPAPMTKIGTAKLSTWEKELRNQGVDTTNIDFDKTIDLFAPNNKIDSQHLITSFINDNGKRVYLQFNDEILFNSIMNMDKRFMSSVLNINRKLNMPLRYGATMANIGFAIPNVISDTAQAAIFSEAGFIPVVDNIIGIMDILSAQNKNARNFFNKIMPGYADRINTLYAIYEQTGATSSTRMSQYRETTQNIMKDVYGTKNNEVLGIKEKYKPLKRLLDIMTYIPEISEQSTRFRVFEKNLDYYRNKGMAETDARIQAALQSRDATQDFGRTGNITREINQLIPFSAARVGSAYTFAEKVKANPKQVAMRTAVLMTIGIIIKAIGYDDKEIEELNQRKKDDNFVLKVGDQIVTIKKPQGILRSILNLGEYVQDLFTGHIEEGKEGERLGEWVTNAIMDNMPADSVTGLVPNMIAPVVENAINKDLYYNSDIVKSYDLELPDSEQYYDYNSQLAIWLGKAFNYSPAKIDNLISGYFGGLGTSVTNVIDWIAGKTGLTVEQPEMGAEDNAVAKRFIVNVNSYSASVDEIYSLKTELTKKKNGNTITTEESKQLDTITNAISEISKINKQIREIKADTVMSGKEKTEQIKLLQNQKTDTARQALGKDLLYSENESKIESTKFYPTRDTLSQNKRTLTLDSNMKKEYEDIANEYYKKYEKQGLYSGEKLEQLQEKAKDYAKNYMMKKYKDKLVKSE